MQHEWSKFSSHPIFTYINYSDLDIGTEYLCLYQILHV